MLRYSMEKLPEEKRQGYLSRLVQEMFYET